VVAVYPFGPVLEGAGINITVLSNMGNVDFGIISCRELVPDLWDIAEGFGAAVLELRDAADRQVGAKRSSGADPDHVADPDATPGPAAALAQEPADAGRGGRTRGGPSRRLGHLPVPRRARRARPQRAPGASVEHRRGCGLASRGRPTARPPRSEERHDMGFFKKVADQAKDAANAAGAAVGGTAAPPGGTPPIAEAAMAQQRALGIDTAAMGGPSNAQVGDDDPIWQPIEGISLELYAVTVKKASNLGVTDEAGMAEVAQQEGLDPVAFAAAAKGWTARMGQSMYVGQKFRQHYDPA
jgi:hypothetical protein